MLREQCHVAVEARKTILDGVVSYSFYAIIVIIWQVDHISDQLICTISYYCYVDSFLFLQLHITLEIC